MNTISDNQLYEGCLEAAKSPAYLDTLTPYEKQALERYAKEQQNAKFFSDELRTYYRALPNNIYAAADKVLALLAPRVEVECKTDALDTPERPRFSQLQLALFLIYSRQSLTKANANEVAQQEGYSSSTSGHKLLQHYNRLSRLNNRTGFDEATATKGRNMVAAIREVIPSLTGLEKQRAENEIIIIESKI